MTALAGYVGAVLVGVAVGLVGGSLLASAVMGLGVFLVSWSVSR